VIRGAFEYTSVSARAETRVRVHPRSKDFFDAFQHRRERASERARDRLLSDTNSWISSDDERGDCCSLPPTPISFTINLLYRIHASADDDGTRERSGFGRGFPLEAAVDNTRGQYASTGSAVCRHKSRQ